MAAVTWPSESCRELANPLNVSNSFTGAGQTVIAAPGAGKRIVIDDIILNVDTADATTSLFAGSDEAGNRLVYNVFQEGAGIERNFWSGFRKGKPLPVNTALLVTVSTGKVYLVINYHIENVGQL